MEKLISEIKLFLKTLFFFGFTCCLAPILFISFICVHYNNQLWNYILTVKYPTLEISKSNKIRTLIDTPRNAGIFHFLLNLEGPCDFNKIKENYINHLTEKRTKFGDLKYPKLRQKLVTCWGRYAWVKDTNSSFNINNHVILSSGNYRGRVISENNIQDYVNDLVTKYIASDFPQWQVIVIPITSTAPSFALTLDAETIPKDNFYVLIKVHHLLIAEQKNLHIGEILMLNNSKSLTIDNIDNNLISTEKLLNSIDKPQHIYNIWNQISMTCVNRWNEFIYRYDPLESPDMDKKHQINCVTQLLSILFIVIVTVAIDFFKGHNNTKPQLKYKIRFLMNIIYREVSKRNLTWDAIFESFNRSLKPFSLLKNAIKIMWLLNLKTFLMAPIYFYKELNAIKDLIITGHTKLTSTFTGFLSIYLPLIIYAQIEFMQICYWIFNAPRYIYEELFQLRSNESNVLQVKSYSGRKVVAFSKSIDMESVRSRLNLPTDRNESEFIFACMNGALKDYFEGFENHEVPKMLNATFRSFGKKYFTQTDSKTNNIGGVLFLQLPLEIPNCEQLKNIQMHFERVRFKQIAIYLASIGQTQFDLISAIVPSVFMKILINYFSFHFPVTITEIHGNTSKFKTIWGQNVNDLLYFRPPQSKTCLSLNIHRFGDRSRLAVMADIQLSPEHSNITNFWENYMETTVL